MKIRLMIGFTLVLFLSACASTVIDLTPTVVVIPSPTVNVDLQMEKTREYFSLQTIVAREQITLTPTPLKKLQTPTPWVVISTKAVSKKIIETATSKRPGTPIFKGPGDTYRMACYVDMGVELIILGRSANSEWIHIKFNPGQTCFVTSPDAARTNIIPDATLDLWAPTAFFSISSDLSNFSINTPTLIP